MGGCKMMLEIAMGLQDCHESKVIHRDIKPDNLLINDGNVLIGDLGLARRVIGNYTNAEAYFWYMAPEVESKSEHSQKSDIWNLGCVYLSLLSGKLVENSGTLLCKVSNEELKFKIRSQLKSFHELFQRLILDCLNKNPKLRPTADEVVDKIKHIKSTLDKQLANVIMAFNKTTEIEGKKKEIYAAVRAGDFNKAAMLIAEIKKTKKHQSLNLEMEKKKKKNQLFKLEKKKKKKKKK